MKTVDVLTKLNWANFRGVDDKKMTITFDVLIGYIWEENRIMKKYVEGWETISYELLSSLWTPEFYIEHLKSYQQGDSGSLSNTPKLQQLMLFNDANYTVKLGKEYNDTNTYVSHRVEAQVILYCNFKFDVYPMDVQVCTFKLGSPNIDSDDIVSFEHVRNGSRCLTVSDAEHKGHALQDFDVETNCYQDYASDRTLRGKVIRKMDCVAFNITLTRILRPFLMKYYLPSISIVISSLLSFLIPMTAIAARVSLLATLFLALVNICTSQQVCMNLAKN